MAKIKEIRLTGRIGRIILSQRGDTIYARAAPEKVRQTVNSTARSNNLAIAANAGKLLRRQLANSLPYPKSKTMQNNFGGTMMKWLARDNVAALLPQTNLPFISGFSFNDASCMSALCKLVFTVSKPNVNELVIGVPAFVPTQAFRAPAGTAGIVCTLQTAWCNLLNPVAATSEALYRLDLPYTDTPIADQHISLQLPATAGCLLVTALCIRFVDGSGLVINNPEYLPAQVLDARYC